ncbi:hypothetical protein [Thiorhodovibrio frisius]|uniref:Uncharacterized protein n=1 Tax=Thiorhodovibrio frisius TaxID=631362 RepID=H8Z8B7_9GAMM|nr:hypothetical protein [Thiorhodovibrio frisius]EIC21066.1 hypothetical protein Thi970DRAFT_04751 [Thiorhodovibrio frisius]WPL22127.1 hypothetical protein Thiofri_02280 [Thiorhodovibrio frisius]
MGDNGSAWYILGLSTGFIFGLAIAAPSWHSVVVPLKKTEHAALVQATANARMERRICLRVREAFIKSLGSETDLDFLCADPIDATPPER